MTKFSLEVKLKAVQMYLSGIGSTTVACQLGIKKCDSVLMWVARYRKYGVQGLEIRLPKYDYAGDFKLKVLNWKKQHKASYSQTALQFDISKPGKSPTGKESSINMVPKSCLSEEDGQNT